VYLRSNILNSFRVNYDTDRYVVVAKFRDRLSVSENATQITNKLPENVATFKHSETTLKLRSRRNLGRIRLRQYLLQCISIIFSSVCYLKL
jgi:hypothetical protein